ncbi:MAG TPA: heavy metal translocating P-type ATPase [Candidatus Egerieousia sp.]|nr:heavy metal translocating P-type ATPase [Candidatus Egerieousia sp.]
MCKEEKHNNFKHWVLIISSAVLLLGGIVLEHFAAGEFCEKNQWALLIWYVAAFLPVGLPVIIEACKNIRQRDIFSEYTLMSIATIGAFCIKQYPEAVAVMLLYSIGELFQDKAVAKAKKNISALIDLKPQRLFEVGSVITLKAGERIPQDGILLSENAGFNTAALTGESVPRTIKTGEEVLAGMIVSDKVVKIQITKEFGESAIYRILKMVQDASERKAPTELFIRKFARIYTPAVMILAVLIVLVPYLYSIVNPAVTTTYAATEEGFQYVFSDWLYRGLVFLVISCPCALVLSIPLSYFAGIGAASRKGILFKGGNYLDAITKINAVVFDKTGTLTKGLFEVQNDVPDSVLYPIAAVEHNSNHPIAKAILEYAKKKYLATAKNSIGNSEDEFFQMLPQISDVKEIAGKGLTAVINGLEILVGNAKLLQEKNIAAPEEISATVKTVVCCSIDGKFAGYILLADTVKEDARAAAENLKKIGITDLAILSGDKSDIVKDLADNLGFPKYYGDLMPEGKVEHIKKLSGEKNTKVAFVGDGINDAPVMATADIGIAMGVLGSDAAIETADVVIETDQPSKVATAFKIGKCTKHIVTENIILALGIKLLILVLGALGFASLWAAVFADSGVALLAVLNSMRIRTITRKD